MNAAPDLFEPIEGWRSWLVATDRGEPRLRSVVRGDLWAPRQRFVAVCSNACGSVAIGPHTPPSADCTCGAHAARLRSEAAGHLAPPSRRTGIAAIGRVALWGGVVEGDVGWRASFAYPIWLELIAWRDDSDAAADLDWARRSLERSYGVPVTVGITDTERAGLTPPRARGSNAPHTIVPAAPPSH
jgi:hypothetical protein